MGFLNTPNVPRSGKYVPNPKSAHQPTSADAVFYRSDVGGAGGIAGTKPQADRGEASGTEGPFASLAVLVKCD